MAASIISRAVVAAILLVSFGSSGTAAELLFPSGYDISVHYSLNRTVLASTDTLVVTRTLVNKTSFVLHSLYFSDNLPPDFVLTHHSAKRNRTIVTSLLNTDRDAPAIPGQVGYYWVFDNPSSATANELLVNPGDSITLTARFVCTVAGDYQLPLHTTVFYGEEPGGFFATASQQNISVKIVTDVGGGEDLPSTYLTSRAYPNPFNGLVTIQFDGARLGGTELELEIYNALGQRIHGSRVAPSTESGTVVWNPEAAVGTGVYFYRLRSGPQTSGGKLMLLK